MGMCFEDLEVWQMARDLVKKVYSLTRKTELQRDFGLCSQIQRAAVSIMSNIAEGFERSHPKEKIQAYNIARASTGGVRSLLYVIQDVYENTAEVSELQRSAVNCGKLISGLIASTQKRLS
jgi:four helix bundle protein